MLKFVIVLMLSCFGCAGVDESAQQERERETRQQLVFDISGRYIEDASSGVPAQLSITNENGLHDVKATFEVPAGMGEEDRALIEQKLITDHPDMLPSEIQELIAKIELALLKIELGAGATFSERGGENVPFDRVGDVSEIAMRKSINETSGKSSMTYQIVFDLYLTAFRSAQRLSYESTSFTDDLGKSSKGSKGLIITVRQFTTINGIQESKELLSEMGLTLAPFLKFN